MQGIRDGKPVEGRVFMVSLFDPSTGEIVHVHRVVAFDSDPRVNQAYAEQRAWSLASPFHGDVTKLRALTIDHSKVRRGFKYKVDPKTLSLVEIPLVRP